MFLILVRMKILIVGQAIVLYESNTGKYVYWKKKLANSIKKLYINANVLDHHVTIAATLIDSVIVEKLENYTAQIVISLRLKLANKTKAITTVTHRFIKLLN